MRIYEELFILKPDIAEPDADAIVDQIRQTVTASGGTIDKVDKWGLRKLAYRVGKQAEGFYILVQFSTAGDAVREIERRLRVNDAVLKFLTVRIDEKLKWLEKRKKIRDKRAARRPPSVLTLATPPGGVAPGVPAPGAPIPGSPVPGAPVAAEPVASEPAASEPVASTPDAPLPAEPAPVES